MKKLIIALLFTPFVCLAQTSPNLFNGQIPTASQWNSYFSNKTDYPAACNALPALTGDVTTSAGSCATVVDAINGVGISLGGTFTMSGAHTFTGTLTGNTAVTFPTSGTLLTSSSLNAALPNATSSQLYGGTGAAGAAAVFSLGGNLAISGSVLNIATQPTIDGLNFTDIPNAAINGLAASATTNALNASNISSGTLPAARLPAPTASTLGGIESFVAVTHQCINAISTSGVPSAVQLAYGDLSSGAPTATTLALGLMEVGTGLSVSAGVVTPTWGTGANQVVQGGVVTAAGPTGSATVAPIVTINAAGQVTALSSATITPAIGSVTGLGTGVTTALGDNVGSVGAFVVNGGAGGTPSSINLTNATNVPAKQYCVFQEQYSSGTTGVNGTAAAFNVRALNTTVTCNISGVSLSSNQITGIPTGIYRFIGSATSTAPASTSSAAQLELYDVTNSAYLSIGMSAGSTTGTGVTVGNNTSTFDTVVSITGPDTVELSEWISGSGTPILGRPAGSGQVEVYSRLVIIQE